MGVGGQRHTLAALPPGKTQYPLCRRLGGPQGRSGRVLKIPSPLGFDPQTAQPVASRYTDWAIPASIICGEHGNNFVNCPHFLQDVKDNSIWRRKLRSASGNTSEGATRVYILDRSVKWVNLLATEFFFKF